MISINFQQCLTEKGGVVQRHGLFKPLAFQIALGDSEKQAKVLRDEIANAAFTWGSLSIPVEAGLEIVLYLEDSQLMAFHSSHGLLIERRNGICLFPASPRLLMLENHGRILEWEDLDWNVKTENSQTCLVTKAPKAGWIEYVWCDSRDKAKAQDFVYVHPFEEQIWAVEGCWSSTKALGGFWDFWTLGTIYCGRFAAFGRFPSAQTAWSLYKIASVLASKTGKAIYVELMAEIAYTALTVLNDTGVWENGEWLAEPETHLRFQIDGIHLLLAAYEHFGDEALLAGSERAGSFILRMRDELANGGWWFLHDTLELDEPLLVSRYPFFYAHQRFGKKRANTFTLNTHLSALHVLYHLAQVTQNPIYQEAYDKGLQALNLVFSSTKRKFAHYVAEKLLEISFENQPAFWFRRGLRYLVRNKIRPRLTGIQRFWPSFITPGGYLWRDMALPAWGYWYHLVNLYDLLLLYQLDPHPWLKDVIDRGMAYTLRSNLVNYLIGQKHYIVPQWIQILTSYAAIHPQFNHQLIEREIVRVQAQGFGLPR